MPSTSAALSPASMIALRMASTAMARVVRRELREYSVSPTPTMQYLSRRVFIESPLSPRPWSGSPSGVAVLAVGLRKDLCEELAGVRPGRLRDRLGRALGDDLTAFLTALGPEVDHVIRGLDHVQMVLDDQDGVAGVDQAVEHAQELLDVVEMEPRRRLVQDVEHLAGRPRAQLGGDLEPLRLAARQRRRRLTEPEIAEADGLQGSQATREAGLGGEEVDRLVDRHLEHVAHAPAAKPHAEDVCAVAPPLALGAGDVHVFEEVHLELLEAVALTRLAAPARHVEGERAGVEAERLRPRERREELADLVERLHVGDRVGAGGAPDRFLIDEADALQVLGAGQRVVGAGRREVGLEGARDGPIERVVHEGGLARARDARHDRERVQGDADRHVLEVVLARAHEGKLAAAAAPERGHRDRLA